MSHWVWMIMSSKRHLKSWVVKCGQWWEKNLPGTKMENWPIGKWVGGSSLLLFPQHHSQRCVQWAYSRWNCTTEKWRRSKTRAERNALSAAWPCGCNMHEPGGLPDLFQARTPAFRVQPATIRNKKWPRWPQPGERGNPRYYLPWPSPSPPPHHPALTQKLSPIPGSLQQRHLQRAPEGREKRGKKKREGKYRQTPTPYFTRRGTRPTSGSASRAVVRKEKRRRRASGLQCMQPAPQKKMKPRLTRRWKRAVGLRQDNKYTPPVYNPLLTYWTERPDQWYGCNVNGPMANTLCVGTLNVRGINNKTKKKSTIQLSVKA